MRHQATITITLTDEGNASVELDGKITAVANVIGEDHFIEFLQEATSDYWWWIGEAWRNTLDTLEDPDEWDEDEDEE